MILGYVKCAAERAGDVAPEVVYASAAEDAHGQLVFRGAAHYRALEAGRRGTLPVGLPR